jgi:Protein of unknown function (DUF4242)
MRQLVSQTQEYKQMPVYMVERDLPGIQMEELADAQKRAIAVGKELTAEGHDVRYIRSTFVPGENKCMCLFEAANPDYVREANERAQIPFTRIVPAEDLTPDD